MYLYLDQGFTWFYGTNWFGTHAFAPEPFFLFIFGFDIPHRGFLQPFQHAGGEARARGATCLHQQNEARRRWKVTWL